MRQRHLKATLAALIVVLLVSSGCATTRSGEDKMLVRAQQSYETARETFNVLFSLEYANRVLIESKLPGTHAKVDALRHTAKEQLPRLLRLIDAYSAAGDQTALVQALAVVEAALQEAQTILSLTGGA